MGEVLITGPAAEPLDRETVKLHLRVDHDTDNALIDALIAAARQYVESFTGRKLITQQWKLTLEQFPFKSCYPYPTESMTTGLAAYASRLGLQRAGQIRLPYPPLQDVDEITYLDAQTGVRTTLDPAEYRVDASELVGIVEPAYQKFFPAVRIDRGSVEVTFTCGYGDTGEDVPPEIKQAMLLLIGAWYENRQAVVQGAPVQQLPKPVGVDMLLWHHRVVEAA